MFTIEFIGGEEVVQKLNKIEPTVQKSLLEAITRLSIKLQAKVVSEKLTGQVLKTRTGTLRRSITYKIENNGDKISGKVGTNVHYGLTHEFGFKGAVGIKSHLRTIKKAWGKPIKPRSISVSAHTRNVNLPERSFLRTALREMTPEIQAEIDKALQL